MAVTGFIGGKPSFYNMIPHDGLDFCLDAADINSYDGAGQTWVDLSGNGNSFFRGTTSGSEASDPTFSGTAGKRTASELFSLDGGDLFSETAAHTFAETWHKDNGACSIVAVAYYGTTDGAITLFSNQSVSLGTGILFRTLAAANNRAPQFVAVNNGSAARSAIMTVGPSTEAVFFVAAAIDESVGANGLTLRVNATTEKFTSTYSSPATIDSNAPYNIAGSNNTASAVAGSRIYAEAGWSRRLSDAELDAIYARVKKRYTTLP